MLIPHQHLADYVAGMEKVSVRQQCGEPAFEASKSEALMLVYAGVVEGRGTQKRLKCLFLNVSVIDAMTIAQGHAKKLATQGKSRKVRGVALDVLQRMVSDRKFTVREWMKDSAGKRNGKWTYSHKSSVRQKL